MDADKAQAFAREWVKAWNDHDLEAILSHYADDVVFHSPRIRAVTGKDVDSVRGKGSCARTGARRWSGCAISISRSIRCYRDRTR